MWMFLIAPIAVATISVTIAKSSLFKNLREYLLTNSDKSRIWAFLYKLVSCHYCLSHWVGFFITIILCIKYTYYDVVEMIIIAFAIIGVSFIFQLVALKSLYYSPEKTLKQAIKSLEG